MIVIITTILSLWCWCCLSLLFWWIESMVQHLHDSVCFYVFFPHALPGFTTFDGLRMHLFSKTKRVQCHLGFSWSNWSLGSLKLSGLIQYPYYLQHGHFLHFFTTEIATRQHPGLERGVGTVEKWFNTTLLRELLKWIEMYPSIPPFFKPI